MIALNKIQSELGQGLLSCPVNNDKRWVKLQHVWAKKPTWIIAGSLSGVNTPGHSAPEN